MRDDKRRRREGKEEVEWRAAVNGFKQEAYEKVSHILLFCILFRFSEFCG